MKIKTVLLMALAFATPMFARADGKAVVVSKGEEFDFKRVLKEEGTTVVLFIQDTSAMEQQFLTDLEKDLIEQNKVLLDLVRLKDTGAPAAQQYEVKETPT